MTEGGHFRASESLYSVFRRRWNLASPFLCTASGALWTYGDLDTATARLASRLRQFGLPKGARVVSLVERSAHALVLYLATLRSGLVYVPLNPKLTDAELRPILRCVDPSLVVCKLGEEPRLTYLHPAVHARILSLGSDGAGTLQDLPEGQATSDASVACDDPAAILFTSGTTGRPKGVVIPHNHLVAKADSLSHALGWHSGDRLLHAMPLYHAHGLFMTTHCVLASAASMLLVERFEAGDTAALLPSVTVFSGVPTMYSRLAAAPEIAQHAAHVRLFVSASAPLGLTLYERFRRATGHAIVECWGMTETMTNAAHSTGKRPGSVGKALPGVEIRAIAPDGEVRPAGQAGQLEVRSVTRFCGYWRQQNEGLFTRDGFFRTGDIGSIDLDGYVTIIGRSGDTIITGGYNVHPHELERLLEARSDVLRAAVFGVPHPDYGEAVVAAVEAQEKFAPELALDELRREVSGYKVPKAIIVVGRLPLNELGKVRRGALSQQFSRYFLADNSAEASVARRKSANDLRGPVS